MFQKGMICIVKLDKNSPFYASLIEICQPRSTAANRIGAGIMTLSSTNYHPKKPNGDPAASNNHQSGVESDGSPEYTVMADIIDTVAQTLPTDGSVRVREVRLKRGSAIALTTLKQAFEKSAFGTILEGATLKVETIPTLLTCACGNQQAVTSDEVVAHLWVCPRCGGVLAVNDRFELELLGVEVEAAS